MKAEDRKYWEIKNSAEGAPAELWIYEQIGADWFSEGVTAKDLCKQLAQLNVMNIDVHINSPGGSVVDGLAIYNALGSTASKRVEPGRLVIIHPS